MLELREFLTLGGLREDLLGLLSAARGGLTAHDLAELASSRDSPVRPYHIQEVLDGSRLVKFEPALTDTRSEVAYVLGHDELFLAAGHALGPECVGGWWTRIQVWADAYKQQDWPPTTPIYLLRSYYQQLCENNEVARLAGLGLDAVRHDRMLDSTGGDAWAFAEVRTALELIAESEEPDLGTALRLAQYRDYLGTRNRSIPPELPAAWFALDHPRRAHAIMTAATECQGESAKREVAELVALDNAILAVDIANSIQSRPIQVEALCKVVSHISHTNLPLAQAIFERVLPEARSLEPSKQHDDALGAMAIAAAYVGEPTTACAAIATIAEEISRVFTTRRAAKASAQFAGAPLQIVGSSESLVSYIVACTEVASAIATQNQEEARKLVEHAQFKLHTVDERERDRLLGYVARAAARCGDLDVSHQTVDAMNDPIHRSEALMHVAQAAARCAGIDTALAIANSIGDSGSQSWALAKVAEAAAFSGNTKRAVAIWSQAKAVAETVTVSYLKSQIAASLAYAMATIDPDSAGEMARTITDANDRSVCLAELAQINAAIGRFEIASTFATQAALFAHRTTSSSSHREALNAVTAAAVTLAGSGDVLAAEGVANAIPDATYRTKALARVALATASRDPGEAQRIAEQAEATARIVPPDQDRHDRSLAQLARAIAITTEDLESALEMVEKIVDPLARGWALTELSRIAAYRDNAESAVRIANMVTTTQRGRSRALAAAVQSVARSVALESPVRAQEIASSIEDIPDRIKAFAAIAHAVSSRGDRATARRIAELAQATAHAITDFDHRIASLIAAASASLVFDRDAALQLTSEASIFANQLTNPYDRALRLVDIATAINTCGDTHRAVETATQAAATAQSIDSQNLRQYVLHKAAQATAAFHPDTAKKIGESINDSYDRTLCLAAVAEAAAASGDMATAREIAAQAAFMTRVINDPSKCATALARISLAFTRVGDCATAQTIAKKAELATRERVDERDWTIRNATIARYIADAGFIDLATSIANAAGDPTVRNESLVSVAEAVAESESFDADAKLDFFSSIPIHAVSQLAAEIASHQVACGQVNRARRLVARALTVGPWYEQLLGVVVLDPSLVGIINVAAPGSRARI